MTHSQEDEKKALTDNLDNNNAKPEVERTHVAAAEDAKIVPAEASHSIPAEASASEDETIATEMPIAAPINTDEKALDKAAAVTDEKTTIDKSVNANEESPVAEGIEAAVAAPVDAEREAKLKAAAEARAARAAAKAAKESEAAAETPNAKGDKPAEEATVDAEREAKLKAAAEARAARAAAKAAKEAEAAGGSAEPEQPKGPSPKQPHLNAVVALLQELVAPDAVKEFYLNERNDDMPMIVADAAHWKAAAKLLKEHVDMSFRYLRNISGVDYETHMEVVYHMINLDDKRELAVKVRTDRESPSIDSVTPIWATAIKKKKTTFN